MSRIATTLCLAALVSWSALAAEPAAPAAPEGPAFKMNPKLAGVPDNTWVKMAPKMEPDHKNFGGFGHPKGESFLVYDESANLTVWFGGCSAGYTNATWLYNCSEDSWKEANPGTWITVQGTRDLPDEKLPPGCCQAAICYSPDARQCLMLKTGGGSDWTAWNQRLGAKHPQVSCWWYNARENKWTLKEWKKEEGPRAPMYICHQFHYDRAAKRGLAFGGLGSGSSACNDLWAYDPEANRWTDLKAENPPPKRIRMSACFDEKRGRMIVFGGQGRDDTWIYDPKKNAWREVKSKEHPSAREVAASCYDAANGVMVLCGGLVREGKEKKPQGDTWVFDSEKEEWHEMKPAGGPVVPRVFQMAYDRVNNVSVVVTGSGTWVYRYKKAAGEPSAEKLQ